MRDFLVFLLILGSFTKRAQIPFSAWLPAAMAAPTPVSSLVHSSTLVTAGVYLVIRFSCCLDIRKGLLLCFFMGLLTIIMRGLVANFEADLKKVIALSTLRQLGLMMLVLGLGKPVLAFFHLVIHAIFKSTLFMRRGFIIHNNQGRQDGRFLGNFGDSSPLLGVVFCCTNIALCGFPFLAGFFSKDIIMELGFRRFFCEITVFLLVIRVGLTLIYRLRVIFIIRGQTGKIFRVRVSSDFGNILVLRLLFLFIMRFSGGFFLRFFLLDFLNFFVLSIKEKFFVLLRIIFTFFLIFNFINIFYLRTKVLMFSFLNLIIYLPNLTTLTSNFVLSQCSFGFKVLEKGWLEILGPFFLKEYLNLFSTLLQQSQFVKTISYYLMFRFILLVFFVIICLKNSKSIMLKP